MTLNFNNMSTAVVFLDIEKAFDTIWHPGLLYKLSKLEFSVTMIKLISSFLSQRKFILSVEGEMSTAREMQAGVPQGSVLPPTLCSMYINHTPKKQEVLIWPSLSMTLVYMPRIANRVMFSESCSKVIVLLRCGVSAETFKLMKINLGPYISLIDVDCLRFISH
jgi:hypothetical protein